MPPNMKRIYKLASVFLLLAFLLNLFLGVVALLSGNFPVGIFNLAVGSACLLVWYIFYWRVRAT